MKIAMIGAGYVGLAALAMQHQGIYYSTHLIERIALQLGA
jgi:2-polyprenyl-6-methoxyphenol hydroxylase-like FAD-dependent oxidoreductase